MSLVDPDLDGSKMSGKRLEELPVTAWFRLEGSDCHTTKWQYFDRGRSRDLRLARRLEARGRGE